MKKTLTTALLAVFTGMSFPANAQTAQGGLQNERAGVMERADACLAEMERAAQQMPVKGVAMVGFIPFDTNAAWTSKTKVVGAFANGKVNYYGLANTKVAEMADTHTNSGSGVRKPLFGEHGYPGGLIKELKYGYAFTVFSGGTGEQDVEVARRGIECMAKPPAFADRILPAPTNSGFQMPGFDIWCGSVIKGEDGRYYMFASRWPSGNGYEWILDSEVVLAASDNPVGPYQFENVVLPKRGTAYWDGMVTHNPSIHKYGDTYLLYYTGATYTNRDYETAWQTKRIGLATAKSVRGPWTRRNEPVLKPRPGKWDNYITSNPAPCVSSNGSVVLVYKSTHKDQNTSRQDFGLRLGVAVADNYEGPYKQVGDEPILTFAGITGTKNSSAEDGYVWREKNGYHMLAKVFGTGEQLIGEKFAGIHAISANGTDWNLADNPKGYSRTIQWADGRTETMQRLERVQLLIEDGAPTHAIFAIINSKGIPGGNIVVPLKPQP